MHPPRTWKITYITYAKCYSHKESRKTSPRCNIVYIYMSLRHTRKHNPLKDREEKIARVIRKLSSRKTAISIRTLGWVTLGKKLNNIANMSENFVLYRVQNDQL